MEKLLHSGGIIWVRPWLERLCMSVLLVMLFNVEAAYAQTPAYGLLAHDQSGNCIYTQEGTSGVRMAQCLPFDVDAQWRRNGDLLVHNRSGQCLDGNGSSVYLGPCGAGNPYQQWKPEGRLLKHVASGKCLDSNGSALYFGPCWSQNSHQTWDHGAKITQGALNCKISDQGRAAGYSNEKGNVVLTESSASLFTLGRLGWGARQFDEVYLVQSNVDGTCLSRAGWGQVCDPNDPRQIYRITDVTGGGVIKQWAQTYVKLNPLTRKMVVDEFDNLNRPLATTQVPVRNPNEDLYVSLMRGSTNLTGPVTLGYKFPPSATYPIIETRSPSISCLAYSDRSTAFSALSMTENYILPAKYAQQEGARSLQAVWNSALTPGESTAVRQYLADTPDVATRTLKMYDLMAETQGDLYIKNMQAGAEPLAQFALQTFNAFVPAGTEDRFASAVLTAFSQPLQAMDQGVKSVTPHPIRGRSLMETGGAFNGQGSLQLRLPWALPPGLSVYLPTNGNFRVSTPAFGLKANTAGGGSDPNHSYSDYQTNKADGVFNFVVTIEIDKDLYKSAAISNPFMPSVNGGLEFHFAMSHRINGFGARTRMDSISINVVADTTVQGGIVGVAQRTYDLFKNNRVLPMVRAETQLAGGRSASLSSPSPSFSDWLRPNTNAINRPSSLQPTMVNNSVNSEFFFNPSGSPLPLEIGASQLGQEVPTMEAVVREVNRAQFKKDALVGGLANVVLEVGVSFKWLNRTFSREMACRYDNPGNTGCKWGSRTSFDFTRNPNAIEFYGFGLSSSQANWSWKDVNIPFLTNFKPTLGIILPRFQYVATASAWLAFDDDAAKAMKAGAAQATHAAQ